MSIAPRLYISTNVDGVTRGPWLAVQVGNLLALASLVHVARIIEVCQAGNIYARTRCIAAEGLEQLLHGEFAFAKDDIVCACLEILESIGAWLRATNNGLPSGFACNLKGLNNIATRHQVGIDTDDSWSLGTQMPKERLAAGEGRVEHIDVETLLP